MTAESTQTPVDRPYSYASTEPAPGRTTNHPRRPDTPDESSTA